MKGLSSPAYSFGLRTPAEPKLTFHTTPPADYEVRPEGFIEPEKRFSYLPTRKFGTEPRAEFAPDNKYPGPGSYSHQEFISPSKKTKTERSLKKDTEKEKSDKKTDIPGPGSYNPKPVVTNLTYSMGNKTYALVSERSGEVGPGHYEPNFKSVSGTRQHKIGNGKRHDSTKGKISPGPGAYSVEKASEPQSYKFGKGSRSAKVNGGDVPAPGEYNIPGMGEEAKNKMGKTITPRRPVLTKESGAPGPGAYQPKAVQTSVMFSVGTGKRPSFTKDTGAPGPGAYQPSNPTAKASYSKRSSSFGTSKRPPIAKATSNPGPGEYGYEKSYGSAKYSFAGKKPDPKPVNPVPGPGQYNPEANYTWSNTAHHIIGTGQRSNISKGRPRTIPGPGNYNISGKADGPYWGFAKDQRTKDQEDEDPGPGYYDIPSTIADVPKYLLKTNQNSGVSVSKKT